MKAIYNIPYGLYIVTAKQANKINGCIINTLMQVTSSPVKISITINKDNYTTKMIEKTGMFNVSILDMNTKFDLIQHFGFQSGKDVNKFENFKDYKLANNQIPFITKSTNSYISCKVVSSLDVGTHITFVADVLEDVVLERTETLTYAYYLNNIKPKPEKSKKKVYVCRICGYVYEGDFLPPDFVCPICGHGAEDFYLQEPEEQTENNKQKKYYCPHCGNLEDYVEGQNTCRICKQKMQIVEIE